MPLSCSERPCLGVDGCLPETMQRHTLKGLQHIHARGVIHTDAARLCWSAQKCQDGSNNLQGEARECHGPRCTATARTVIRRARHQNSERSWKSQGSHMPPRHVGALARGVQRSRGNGWLLGVQNWPVLSRHPGLIEPSRSRSLAWRLSRKAKTSSPQVHSPRKPW